MNVPAITMLNLWYDQYGAVVPITVTSNIALGVAVRVSRRRTASSLFTIFLAVSCNPFKLVARSLIEHSYLLVSRRQNGSSSCPAGPTESLIIDF
ncbi:GM12084 [Drosophila sechellia]|uniref:GM12084 n=1 Tax=Drosophila sechellia TaxID=7238 RepID=B4I031_DROSE|nr:GM12084 [Drosophila sechellia]